MGDLEATTHPPVNGAEPDPLDAVVDVTGLVILWSRDEPNRIGEAMFLRESDPEAWTFGRGEARQQDGARRIALVRQRPGAMVPAGAIECPRISRVQLRLFAIHGGGLTVENVGACPMLRDGRAVARAEVVPGEMLALQNEILFLCVRRTLAASAANDTPLPPHPFGGADAFGIVGESQAAWDLRRRIVAIAGQRFHTLILGESGCGKELVAQAIHARSARAGRPMVSRNAATIPEGLADAELFGSVRSYPNVGMPERPGLVGQAHGSTLFLDEFADLAPGIQTRLLRVMDDGEYNRLGEAMPRRSDLRILAATNRPAGHIKHDVLARLKVVTTVPDLNARREDIPLLVAHLLRRHAESDLLMARRFFPGGDLRGAPLVSPVLIEALVRHRYTTHIRELDALLIQSALEGQGRYVELSRGPQRDGQVKLAPPPADDAITGLPQIEQRRLTLLRQHRFSATECGRDPAYPGNRQTADLHLRHLVCKALRLSDWDARRAAQLLAGADDVALRKRASARIDRFLSNLNARLAGEPEPELRRALTTEWKGNVDAVLQLVEALRAGKVSNRGA